MFVKLTVSPILMVRFIGTKPDFVMVMVWVAALAVAGDQCGDSDGDQRAGGNSRSAPNPSTSGGGHDEPF